MTNNRIFIASPLEPEHVERIRAVAPDQVTVDYQPDLLPPTRYIADHGGASFSRTAEQERRWRDALAAADILWDLPRRPEDVALARRLKWIQTTSTGVGQSIKTLGLQDRDVIITTARGVHAGPLAEFVFMALLAHFRGLRHLDAGAAGASLGSLLRPGNRRPNHRGDRGRGPGPRRCQYRAGVRDARRCRGARTGQASRA